MNQIKGQPSISFDFIENLAQKEFDSMQNFYAIKTLLLTLPKNKKAV